MNIIGIIGGSAFYSMDDLVVKERVKLKTPYGDPSGEYVIGELSGKEVVFLPRHGINHQYLPSDVNYRANIFGFKMLGVKRLLSVSAVGSLKEELRPLDIVLVDQFIDRTNQARKMTFLGNGAVGHIPFAEPICTELRTAVNKATKKLDVTVHNGGTYLNMEGPAFSTKAESLLYKSWGVDVIGMTNLAEAKLSREAGICYSTIAMVTDYDCWRDEGESVTTEMIIANLNKNVENGKIILKNTINSLSDERSCECGETLKNAFFTPLETLSKEVAETMKMLMN
ncbi:MAG: S-methyl-5'-thioadenosine phosphorylase [Candidatus Omnitrophica bacterium]|nr:S-methyl-5'-thioadenosine phosphorylase [Candidatus Omnitrophota bacterium]